MRVLKETTCLYDNRKSWYLCLLPSITIDYQLEGFWGRTVEISFCFLFWSIDITFNEI